jgi:hypothetical protein
MKQRLYLLFSAILLVAIGTAHAQSLPCVVGSLTFPGPTSGPVVKAAVQPGTCVQTPGATGRLRWDNQGSGQLQLFDTDDTGKPLLWCAHLHDGNTTCAVAKNGSFCLQSDGNAVIYAGSDCSGEALWASNTVGANIGGEVMEVGDGDQGFCGITGEKAVILNNVITGASCPPVWTSTSFDPS